MEYGKPIAPTAMTTTVIDDVPEDFNNLLAVPKGTERLYEDSIYEANANIYPLATYGWNDYSTPADGIVTVLADKSVVPDSTAVPVVQDVTTVYIEDSSTTDIIGNYYRYIGVSATINFTTIDPASPANWELITNMRFYDVIPAELSIYWKFIDVKNSVRHLDGKVWNQTVANDGENIITNYYTLRELTNTVAFFNTECTSIEITVRDEETGSLIMETKTLDMKDYQGIVTPYDWCFTPLSVGKNVSFVKIPVSQNIIIQIDYLSINTTPKLGETIFARVISGGKTVNKPTGNKRNFDTITIDDEGRKTVKKSKARIDEIDYEVVIDKDRANQQIEDWGKLINENLLIIGDETGTYTVFINYGYIQNMPYEMDSSSTKNRYNIKVTTLV